MKTHYPQTMRTHHTPMQVLILLAILAGGSLAGGLFTGAASAKDAGKLALDVALDKPVLLAGKTQTAYLRVGLTGFSLEEMEDRAPVNIAIVLDKSGSMEGVKIEKAREAAVSAIERLNSNDIVSVVTYDSTVNVLIPATKVSDKETIFRRIRQVTAGGNTALFGGVSKGAEELRKFLSQDRVNRLILLSDGLANVGPQTPAQLGELGASLARERIAVTTIGFGLGYNTDLMTKLALMSDGNHYFAEKPGDLAAAFDGEFGRALSVVAQEIQADIRCAPGIRPVRVLGREGRIQGQNVQVFINNLHSNHEKFILLEVEVPERKVEASRQIAWVTVRYDNMKTHWRDELHGAVAASFSESKDLVEKKTDTRVTVDVVQLIGSERNMMAMRLRDSGKIEEARRLLMGNKTYLSTNAAQLKSDKLSKDANQQSIDANNMDEKNWTRQRNIMQEADVWRARQQ